jgi:hypothetical protein
VNDSGAAEEEGEVVEGLPVVAPKGAVESARAQVPAKHAAALAATGFVAGAATVAVVSRRASLRPRRRRRRKAGGLGEIVASNSFLVDVHLLRRP